LSPTDLFYLAKGTGTIGGADSYCGTAASYEGTGDTEWQGAGADALDGKYGIDDVDLVFDKNEEESAAAAAESADVHVVPGRRLF
jgi:hypothetical protein